MPCIALPPFPLPPPLPAGVTLPTFATPPINLNLCCSLQVPSYGLPAITIPIPFLPGVMTTLTTYIKAVQAYLDALMPVCPLQ